MADNYNHLHEQPTTFYPLMYFAALAGDDEAVSLGLAWAQVASRVVHSLIQATITGVVLRFAVFPIGAIILMAFAIGQGQARVKFTRTRMSRALARKISLSNARSNGHRYPDA